MKRSKGSKCLNCGKLLHGENFCSNCGQINDTQALSLRSMLAFVASTLFSSDSRLRNTIFPLLVKPGFLAKEFILGRRARIVHPLRLFIWFLIISVGLNKLELAFFSEDSMAMKTETGLNSKESSDNFIHFELNQDSTDHLVPLSDSTALLIDDIPQYAFEHSDENAKVGLKNMGLESDFQNELVYQIFSNIGKMTYTDFIKSILDNILIVFLLFVPFFAIWMKMLYFRSPSISLVNHVVFILYNHSFVFFLYAIFQIISLFSSIELFMPLLFLYAIYLWFGFKSFYQQSAMKRLIKFILASIGFLVMSAIFTIVSIGIAIYSL